MSLRDDVFTIDVEDWFHIMDVEGTPALGAWDSLPPRIERNFHALLEQLAEFQVKATCFALGWVAERFPAMLREAVAQGHEIASHGYGHDMVHRLARGQFREDIRRAKGTIEAAIGRPVQGYRAPGFSITKGTPWAFDEILAAGYRYDSSIFPGSHGHGGIADAPREPHLVTTESGGRLVEFPVSIVDTPLGPMSFFGGGYLRLFPLFAILGMARRVRAAGRGVVWYIHPREIDPAHPRLAMSAARRFKSYVGLAGTATKLSAILGNASFATFADLAPLVESGRDPARSVA